MWKVLLSLLLLLVSIPAAGLSASDLWTKWSAPTPVIADEVPLWARLLVEAAGLCGAIAGIVSGAGALLTLSKLRSDSRGQAPREDVTKGVTASFPLLILLLGAWVALKLYLRHT